MCNVTWAGTSSSVLFTPRHVRTSREKNLVVVTSGEMIEYMFSLDW